MYKEDFMKYKAQIRMTIETSKQIGKSYNNLID